MREFKKESKFASSVHVVLLEEDERERDWNLYGWITGLAKQNIT